MISQSEYRCSNFFVFKAAYGFDLASNGTKPIKLSKPVRYGTVMQVGHRVLLSSFTTDP